MPSIDPLILAGDAAAALETHGFVACGRRVDGVTRVDFWGRRGASFQYALEGDEQSVTEVVAACLALAGEGGTPSRKPGGSTLPS